MEIHQICRPFHELSPDLLYNILQLRSEVFVLEQHCVYQDLDNKDQESLHLMFFSPDELVAYARLLPPGLSFSEASFGRVITKKSIRKEGIGKLLIKEAIANLYHFFGKQPIRIGAQSYLIDFYASFGFKTDGDSYFEDGIEHIEMIKELNLPED